MRMIKVETCGDCPMIEIRSCGCSYACGHNSIKSKRPYMEDRVVKRESEPPEWCPLDKSHAVCVIVGSEIDFKLEVAEFDVEAKARDIWANPDKYWDVLRDTERAYYGFLKYLWISYPDGREVRLADII